MQGTRRNVVVALIGALALLAALGPGTALATDYTSDPFTVSTHTTAFGQAPVFTPAGQVVHAKNYGGADGQQVYIANLDGTQERCVTCGKLPGPNGVPAVSPDGQWILFHSWNGHHITVGSPGFGGLGSELYVIRPDGSGLTQLTGLDAAHGSGEGEDDYHAYWSPAVPGQPQRIVYAHLNWNFITNGGDGKWDVRVADFVGGDTDSPALANTTVVRPNNGHYYETQWWAPDGSGFLYTESWGTAMNLELWFCKLTYNADGSVKGCDSQRLTNNSAWDEQAIFTPDMQNVIFMSTRDHPGQFNTEAHLAQDAGLPADADYMLVLPLFEAGFLQPVAQEATDLYELNLATKSVRRLTYNGDDGWIIPEFAWDPTNSFLMWTEARFPDGLRTPLPVDPAKQIAALANYLQHPELPPPPQAGGSIETLPLERRTEIGHFG